MLDLFFWDGVSLHDAKTHMKVQMPALRRLLTHLDTSRRQYSEFCADIRGAPKRGRKADTPMLYSNGSNFCTENHRHAQDNAIEPQELRARPRPLRSVQVIATYELAGVECWVSQPQNGMPGMLVTM